MIKSNLKNKKKGRLAGQKQTWLRAESSMDDMSDFSRSYTRGGSCAVEAAGTYKQSTYMVCPAGTFIEFSARTEARESGIEVRGEVRIEFVGGYVVHIPR